MAPLIIDQPADDVGNRALYDAAVKILSKVCRPRLAIVATHHAHIIVVLPQSWCFG